MKHNALARQMLRKRFARWTLALKGLTVDDRAAISAASWSWLASASSSSSCNSICSRRRAFRSERLPWMSRLSFSISNLVSAGQSAHRNGSLQLAHEQQQPRLHDGRRARRGSSRERWQGRREADRPLRSWQDGIIFGLAFPAISATQPGRQVLCGIASQSLQADSRAVQEL